MTFLGLGFMLFMNAISSFRDECPEKPSRDKNFSFIWTISSLPLTLNLASFSPSLSWRPSPPGGW